VKRTPYASDAVISADGRYRYSLTRTWNAARPHLLFIMLNPSTADVDYDDPTITRCCSYAADWHYGGINVGNIAALRATNPRALANDPDPIGPDNPQHLHAAITAAGPHIIAAWGGSYPRNLAAHVARARDELRSAGARILGLTAAGDPRHPLYLRGDLTPQPWPAQP
jgi:hypothetical protein